MIIGIKFHHLFYYLFIYFITDKRELLRDVSPSSIWYYFCRHNRISDLLKWVKIQYEKAEPAESDYLNQPITLEMINKGLSLLPASNQHRLKSALSR